MFSLPTDPMHDLGTLMCHTIDQLTAEMNDAIPRTPEITSPEPDDSDTFDYYAYACMLLDCR